MMRRPISLACIAHLGHCERITSIRFPHTPRWPLTRPFLMIPQVRRRDGGDGVHVVPQDSGHSGRIWLPLLDAVLLLHHRQAAVRDDWPVRPPDVQPDVSFLVRQFSPCDRWIRMGHERLCIGTTRDSTTCPSSISLSIAPPLSRSVLFGQALSRGFGGPLRRAGS
jgi:hypothetical protein